MAGKSRLQAAGGAAAVLSLCLIFTAGCNKGQDTGGSPGETSSGGPGGPPGGMMRGGPGGSGGMMGRGPGGPGGMMRGGGPIAANASGGDIYQQKCGCHGTGGKGGRAPVLTGGAGKSEDELFKIIHDGKGKMPAFASQLTDDQIKKAASTVKRFK